MNYKTVDAALNAVEEVNYPANPEGDLHMKKLFVTAGDRKDTTGSLIRETLGEISVQRGDDLPVSKIPVDGTFPTATSQYERRSTAEKVPVWNPEVCTQCGICAFVCPHACIRMKNVSDAAAAKAPKGFLTAEVKPKAVAGMKATMAIATEDCYECGLCFNQCPLVQNGKDALTWKSYADDHEFKTEQIAAWDYFLSLPETPAEGELSNPKALAYKRPLFEFSGACGPGLRRDALHQAYVPALRRQGSYRQRHGLFLDLRREPAHHSLLHHER